MPQDNLLRDAIADAKQVRETAIANAKSMLTEAFTPKLTSMISARLRNEAEGLTEDNDGSSGIGGAGVTVDDPAPKKPSAKSSSSSHIQNPGQEEEAMGEGPVVEGIDDYGADDDADDMGHEADLGADDVGAGVGGEEPEININVDEPGAEDHFGGAPDADMSAGDEHGDPDELDLEAIIRELEADAHEDEEHPEPELEGFDDVRAGQEVDGPVRVLRKEDAEGVESDGKSPAAVDGVNGGKKVSPGQEVNGTKEEKMDEDINLEEILREIEADGSEDDSDYGQIASENVDLKRKLREHREVIHFLREKIQEVNMLNAKLLYTNKLFRNFELNRPQKVRVVETFDRAGTLREVKLVYATMAESFSGKTAPSGRKATKAITEGMASKPVGSTKPRSTASAQINEEDEAFKRRMQKLAGIKIL